MRFACLFLAPILAQALLDDNVWEVATSTSWVTETQATATETETPVEWTTTLTTMTATTTPTPSPCDRVLAECTCPDGYRCGFATPPTGPTCPPLACFPSTSTGAP